MKKFLLSISSVLALVACNEVPEKIADSTSQQSDHAAFADTSGLASFRAWKVQNELASVADYQAQQAAYSEPAEQPVVKKKTSTPVRKSTTSKPVAQTSRPSQSTSSDSQTSSGGETASTGSGTGTSGSGTAEAPAEKKEGWSKAAKGAVIGGVAGAAGGAVINKKNRVAGAVIGAVIGAGGGYVIGRQADKKDGRIDYTAQ